MVLGYHVIFSAYGFWLPNDPRGSWSDFVGSWELFRFGSATKPDQRKSLAREAHDRSLRLAAKQALHRPAVQVTGIQARAVGRGFASAMERNRVTAYACSILPEHVHLVIGRHTSKVEQMVNWMKGAATRELVAEKIHPFQNLAESSGQVPKCWAQGEWKVFLNNVDDFTRSIGYVEKNPMKEGKPPQRWPFITPYV